MLCAGLRRWRNSSEAFCFFGDMPPALVRLRVDSSSAKAMAERRGVGASRHIEAHYLRPQDKVFARELEIAKVQGKINDSDLVTKVQTKNVIESHLIRLGFHRSGRSGHKALT